MSMENERTADRLADQDRDPISIVLGGNIRRARLARGWTQQQLADAVGRHQTSITRTEAGTQDTTLVDIARIAGAIGVPLSALIPLPDINRTSFELFNYAASVRSAAMVVYRATESLDKARREFEQAYELWDTKVTAYPRELLPEYQVSVTVPGSSSDYDGWLDQFEGIECANE